MMKEATFAKRMQFSLKRLLGLLTVSDLEEELFILYLDFRSRLVYLEDVELIRREVLDSTHVRVYLRVPTMKNAVADSLLFLEMEMQESAKKAGGEFEFMILPQEED